MNRTKGRRGRKRVKAGGKLFKLRKDLDAYLEQESTKTGLTMVRIMEDLLAYRRQFKTWPPEAA